MVYPSLKQPGWAGAGVTLAEFNYTAGSICLSRGQMDKANACYKATTVKAGKRRGQLIQDATQSDLKISLSTSRA